MVVKNVRVGMLLSYFFVLFINSFSVFAAVDLTLQVCPDILDGVQLGDIGLVCRVRYYIGFQLLHLPKRTLRPNLRHALRTIFFSVQGQFKAKEEWL